MAIKTFYITEGDLAPPYPFKVIDSHGGPVSLAGATIYCTMISGNGAVVINNSTTGVVIADAAAGGVEYNWQSGETDNPGLFQIEFRVVLPTGRFFTVPREEEGEAYINIAHRLGS